MNLAFNPHPTPELSTISLSRSTTFRISASRTIPARDRVIDFGKHKGRMLGSLPSTYLKWVSKNLRARDFEEWAKLADEVLTDPIYRDRIEWEFAEKVLNGNSPKGTPDGMAVSELLEISDRFGWDNQDKGGWGKIDFGLLGTSKGGRIPRVTDEKIVTELGSSEKKKGGTIAGVDSEEDWGRRRERRERLRQQRAVTNCSRRIGSDIGTTTRSKNDGDQEQERGEDGGAFPVSSGASPFPGREALLNKVINRRKMF